MNIAESLLQHAKQLYRLPDAWQWYALSSHVQGTWIIEGGVCTAKFTRGKNAGWTNWRKQTADEKATNRALHIPVPTHLEWLEANKLHGTDAWKISDRRMKAGD